MLKGTVQYVDGDICVTYTKKEGKSLIKYVKKYKIIEDQIEKAKKIINTEVGFSLENNFAVLNI